jgi:hypothetical protein
MRLRRRFLYDLDDVIKRALAWLCVGLVVSLVVAWLAAWFVPTQPEIKRVTIPSGGEVVSKRYAMRVDGMSLLVDYYAMLGGEKPIYAEDYGWPVRCWSVWNKQHQSGNWELIAGVRLWGTRPGAGGATAPPWALPLVPRLPHVLVAATFYGGIGWMCWWAYRFFRARSRRSRGLCEACGYGPWQLGSHCPECGSDANSVHGAKDHDHSPSLD